MDRLILLTLGPEVSSAAVGLLFRKIAGLPLLLRNILTLDRAGYQNIGVSLPKGLIAQFQKEIAPRLKERNLNIGLFPPERAKGIENQRQIAANLLIDKDHPFLSTFKIDTQAKARKAEKKILEAIRLAAPGAIARQLNKRISLPISLRIARSGIHPNWITLFNMTVGISCGFFVAEGTYWGYLYGALLFQIVSIIDGCDGEVAKLTFKTSKFGQYFDSLSDNGALISFFIGLMAAYAKGHNPFFTIALSLLLLAGLGGLLWQMIHFLKKHTDSASLVTFDKEYLMKLPYAKNSLLMRLIGIGKNLLRKDCFSFSFFLASLAGLLPAVLYVAIGGTWIANAVLLYLKLQPAAATRPVTYD